MPPPTLADIETQLYVQAVKLFIAADDLEDINSEISDPEDDMIYATQTVTEDLELAAAVQAESEEIAMVLRSLGVELMVQAEDLRGDGTRGPYLQYPRSKDFFECLLSLREKEFRTMFR